MRPRPSQQGFAEIEYDAGGFDHNINVYQIHAGESIYRGRRYKARNLVQQIQEDTDWHQFIEPTYDEYRRVA